MGRARRIVYDIFVVVITPLLLVGLSEDLSAIPDHRAAASLYTQGLGCVDTQTVQPSAPRCTDSPFVVVATDLATEYSKSGTTYTSHVTLAPKGEAGDAVPSTARTVSLDGRDMYDQLTVGSTVTAEVWTGKVTYLFAAKVGQPTLDNPTGVSEGDALLQWVLSPLAVVLLLFGVIDLPKRPIRGKSGLTWHSAGWVGLWSVAAYLCGLMFTYSILVGLAFALLVILLTGLAHLIGGRGERSSLPTGD